LPPPPPLPPQSQSKGEGSGKEGHKGSGKEGQGNRNSDGELDIHFSNGMQEGFQNGFDKGYSKGYSTGYSKGYAEAKEDCAETARCQAIIAKKGHDNDLDSQPRQRVVDKKRHDDWGLDKGGGKVGGTGELLRFPSSLTPHAPHRSESDPGASSSQRQARASLWATVDEAAWFYKYRSYEANRRREPLCDS
jgi:hypothetical protein